MEQQGYTNELSEQLMYYMNRQKELLMKLEKREEDANNLKDLALAYEQLEAERNNLQSQIDELSRSDRLPKNMGQSTDREIYEKRIFQIVHELNIKSKQYSELEGEYKHLQQQNFSLNQTIQHYEQFVTSLRTQLKNSKADIQQKQLQNISLKQQLGFLRERGTGEFNNQSEILLQKLQQVIAEKQAEIESLKNNFKQIDESYQNHNVEVGTFEAVVSDVKFKESLILNFEKKVEYLNEQNRISNLTIQSKNQEIFRLKKQLIEAENKWIVTSDAGLNSSKPRTNIDNSLTRQLQILRMLRPQLQVTKESIRRKQHQILELRQTKQSQIMRLNNQIQDLQIRLTNTNNKLEQQRLHYRQWKISSDNRLLKQSIKPVSNTVSIISTYQKQVKDLYQKLQQSRQDYIQMRRNSQQKSTSLEMKNNELVFRINELNSQLWNSSQQIQVLVKENKGARVIANNLKVVNQQTTVRIAELTNELNVYKSRKQGKSNSNSEARLSALRNNMENLLENDQQTAGYEKNKVNKVAQQASESEQIIGIKNQNRQLHRMLQNRQIQINHLQAAIADLNISLQDYKTKYQQLNIQVISSRQQQFQSHSPQLQSQLHSLQQQNSRLRQQKQLIFSQITTTQTTINHLTIKLQKLQFSNSQTHQILSNIDGLYVSANKLSVLLLMLQDQIPINQTLKKLILIGGKIKTDVDRIISLKQKMKEFNIFLDSKWFNSIRY